MTDCPICQIALLPIDENSDRKCENCGRLWFDVEIDGEKTLQSRPRKVRLIKFPEEGDDLNDCIKPI